MGYTHYWNRAEVMPRRPFREWAADVRRIVAVKAGDIGLAGGLGYGPPEITDEKVGINGAADLDQDHETFGFDRIYQDHSPEDAPWRHYRDGRTPSRKRKVGDFCKTARKPYDLVVCAALIRLLVHFPSCVISSDGGTAEWGPARELCEAVFGTGHDFPPGIDPVACDRCGELAVRAGHCNGQWRRLCILCWTAHIEGRVEFDHV